MSEFATQLRALADAYDIVDAGRLPAPTPPAEPIVTRTRFRDAVEVTMVNARFASVELSSSLVSYADHAELCSTLAGALQAALDEHADAVAAEYLEAGGQPNAAALLWEAQSYASAALMMELDEEMSRHGR